MTLRVIQAVELGPGQGTSAEPGNSTKLYRTGHARNCFVDLGVGRCMGGKLLYWIFSHD